MVQFMIAQRSVMPESPASIDWDWGLGAACRGKCLEVARYMLSRGANSAILDKYPLIKKQL